jgi:hypothetical protein
MIKFIHKKHIQETSGTKGLVIYYNVSDIFLGLTLFVLVIFFINDYISHRLRPDAYCENTYRNQIFLQDKNKNLIPTQRRVNP